MIVDDVDLGDIIARHLELAEWIKKDHVAARVIAAIEARRKVAVSVMIGLFDLNTPEAKQAHIESKACSLLFDTLNDIINDGKAAQRMMGEEREH